MVHLKQKRYMELFKKEDKLISAINPNHDMAHVVECYKTPNNQTQNQTSLLLVEIRNYCVSPQTAT